MSTKPGPTASFRRAVPKAKGAGRPKAEVLVRQSLGGLGPCVGIAGNIGTLKVIPVDQPDICRIVGARQMDGNINLI
jgi:hypothetical protein